MARKCSLPPRLCSPGNDAILEDSLPKELPDQKVEEYALRAFFYDYCVASINLSLSRGFLNGLELMLHRQGQQSDLAKACKVVAFANNGRKLFRPLLMQKAEAMYHELLGSLARAIEIPSSANSVESLMITMLLGLYEMINAGEADPGFHNAHANGVAAILQTGHSSLDILGAAQYIRFIRSHHPLVLNGIIHNYGVFSTPCSRDLEPSLDDLLLKFGAVWERTASLSGSAATDVHKLIKPRDEALHLDEEFAVWQMIQVDEFKPRQAGKVTREYADPYPMVGFWPGKVDTYFDLSVAAIWNTSRAARILLITSVLEVSKALGDEQSYSRKRQEALILVEEIIASIPYHLTEDLQIFLRDMEKSVGIEDPGKPLGGLLLMHTIYVASMLSFVPPQMQEYMRHCLKWIARYMGIGQASLFAKARSTFHITNTLLAAINLTQTAGYQPRRTVFHRRMHDCLGWTPGLGLAFEMH